MGGQISLVASLVLAFLLLLPSQGWAQDVETKTTADGFKYTVENEHYAKIVGFDQTKLTSTEELVVPSMIEDGNMHYFVTQFGPDDVNEDGVFQDALGTEGIKISFQESTMPMERLTIKSSAFKKLRCKEVVLPSSNDVTIEEYAFNNCYIDCVTFTNDHPTNYSNPGDVEAPRYHSMMFMDFKGIQKVVIPGWTEIYHGILDQCHNVSVPGSDPAPGIGSTTEVDGLKVELNEDAHTATITGVADGSSAQSYFYIPSTLSYNGQEYTVTAIADNAFKGNSFGSITIPSTVTSIGENAFAESKGQQWEESYPAELYVYLYYSDDDLTKYATDAFSSFAGGLLAIFVPSSNGEAYKTHFSDIADHIYITRTDGNISDDNIFDKGYFTEGGLTYTRQLTEAEQQGGYVTCSLPFGIYPKDESYKDMFEAIYVVDNTIVKKSDGRYYLDPKDKMTSVGDYNPVYLPMLLKLKPGVSEIKFKNSSPRLITGDKYEEFPTALTVKDEQGNTLTDYTMQLCGSLEKKTDCSDIYSFNPDGTFGKHKFDTLNPFRMYLKVTSNKGNSANSPVFYSSINPNGGTTGINAVHTDAAQNNALIYSIDGKLVSSNGSTAGLAKGVYIQNGKKVVVK